MTLTLNRRSDFNCIQLTGANTQTFLQGQVTCDMNMLRKQGDYSFAACCDHKGRMVANFWIVRRENDFLIVLPLAMQPILIDHLQKYAPFSRVTLRACDEMMIYSTTDNLMRANPDTIIITLPNPNRHLILSEQTLDASNQNDSWIADNIEDRLAILTPKTSLLFTPQMIGLEKQGGVSFDKGCYVGQEIVARTHYLGKLKRHLQRMQIKTSQCPQPGDSITNDQGTHVGVIVTAKQTNVNMADVLAVVQDTA